nr:hypothetical protein [Hubei odonate virus 5]
MKNDSNNTIIFTNGRRGSTTDHHSQPRQEYNVPTISKFIKCADKRSTNNIMEASKSFYGQFDKTFLVSSNLLPRCNFNFSMFNNWYDSLFATFKEFGSRTVRDSDNRQRTIYTFGYSMLWRKCSICIKSRVMGPKEDQAYDIICQLHERRAVVQMDLDGAANKDEAPVSNEKVGNTSMELGDGVEEGTLKMPDLTTVKDLANTEESYEFPLLSDRWQMFDHFTISTATKRNGLNKVYNLPQAFLTASQKAPCSTNTLPFQTFAYADCDIEIKVIANGARFATGAVLVGSYPDPYDNFGALSCTVESMIQRDNTAQLSLSANNAVEISIPNLYRRSFVRCYADPTSNKGTTTQQYSALQIEILSPYNVTSGNSNTCHIQLFYRFKKCDFAGMSYGVLPTAQAPSLISDLVSVGTTLFPEAKPLERVLRRTGLIRNQDKPYIGNISQVVPQPRMNFCAGKGVSDNIPLTLDHASTVTILKDHTHPQDPTTMLDIAKRPGIDCYFQWSNSDTSGKILKRWPIVPTANNVTDSRIDTTPTPLKFCTSLYQLWRGDIEIEFIAISNDFHTGALQIETSFNRITNDACQLSGTYTKTFELSAKNKSFKYTAPYIYDTVWRRTGRGITDAMVNNLGKNDSDDPKYWCAIAGAQSLLWPTSVMERTKAYVTVTVVNPLNPIGNVPSTIDIVMTVRAGKNYMLHSMGPSQYHSAYCNDDIKELPNWGRFPSIAQTTDSNESDPRMFVPTDAGSTGEQVPLYYFNAYGRRSDEGVVKISKGNRNGSEYAYVEGPAMRTFHTTDSQITLKDIMRRPILLLSATCPALKVSNQQGSSCKFDAAASYWLPCFVPSHFSGRSPFSFIQNSPLASIATLFRHWRGSLCYTFDFDSTSSKSIYISYVPQTGVRLCGIQRKPMRITDFFINTDQVVSDQYWLAETGVATEIVKPSINPTCSVRVPFDTDLNMCVVSNRVRSKSNIQTIMAREQVADISGHLVIQCEEEVKFKVFMSVGDDFELSHFVGTPHYQQFVTLPLSDDFSARTGQTYGFATKHNKGLTAYNAPQDFRNNDSSRTTTNLNLPYKYRARVHVQMEKVAAVATAGLLGGGFVAYKKGQSAIENVSASCSETKTILDNTLVQASGTMSRISEVAETIGVGVSYLLDVITKAVDKTLEATRGVCDSLLSSNFIIGFILDMVLLVKNFSASNIALHLLKLLNTLLPTLGVKVMDYLSDFTKLITKLLGSAATEQQSVVDPDAFSSLFGFLIFLIGTATGAKLSINPKTCPDFSTALTQRLTSTQGLGFLAVATNFVQYFFKALVAASSYITGSTDSIASTAQLLKLKEDEIQNFVSEVDLITNPLNARMLRNTEMRRLVWKNFVRAEQINRAVLTLKDTRGSQNLMRYVDRMRKFADERAPLATCCPVRREPFVMCIVGESRIGKSYINNELCLKLLKSANVQFEGQPIYTRTPGLKHWDGFFEQQVVVYDDWLSMSETTCVTEQLMELFCLKSSCEFIPPMANLQEKGIRANPYIVSILTNDAFPDDLVSCTAHTPEAVYGRRDVLIDARKKAEYEFVKTGDIPREVLEKYGHLEFAFLDPLQYEPINTARKYYSFEEFYEKLEKKFLDLTNSETKNVTRRLNQLRLYSGNSSLLDDPTQIMYRESFKVGLEEMTQKDPQFAGLYMSQKVNKMFDLLDKVKEESSDTAKVEGPRETIRSWINNHPTFSNMFEKGWLPQVHNTTTLGEPLSESDACNHCMNECLLYFGPSSHLLCSACYFTQTGSCVQCGPLSYTQQISAPTLKKMTALLKRGKEGRVKLMDWFNKLSTDTKTAVACSAFLFVYLGGACALISQLEPQQPNVIYYFPQIEHISYVKTQMMSKETFIEGLCFNEKEFDLMLEDQERTLPRCYHQIMLDNPEDAYEYENRKWEIEHEGETFWIPVNACGKDCVLHKEGNKDKYKQICADWYTLNYSLIGEILFTRVKGNDPRVGVDICDELPPFCVPNFASSTRPVKKTSWLQKWIEKTNNFIPSWLKSLLNAALIGVKILVTLKGLMGILDYFKAQPKEEIESSGSYQTRHFLSRQRKMKLSKFTSKGVKSQSPEDLMISLQNKILHNSMNLDFEREGKIYMRLGLTGMFNRCAVIPKHYLSVIKEQCSLQDVQVYLTSARFDHIKISYSYSPSDFIEGEADIAIFEVPKTCHTFCDLRKYCATLKDWEIPLTSEGIIINCRMLRSKQMTISPIKFFGIERELEVDSDEGKFVANDVLSYNYSQPGACGSLVLRSRHQRPIVGMHFAGVSSMFQQSKGYSVLLSQEMFNDIIQDEVILTEEEVELKPAEEAKKVLNDKVSVQSLGATEQSVFIPTKSKIISSKVAQFLDPPKTLPGFLSGREEDYPHKTSPLLLGCAKHGILTKNFPTHEIDEVSSALWNLKYSSLQPIISNPKKLTLKEAIAGFPSIPGYAQLHLNTSMGYDWIFGSKTQKKDFIEVIRNEDGTVDEVLVDKRVVSELERVTNMRYKGVIPFIPYIDELKDERRKIQKRLKEGSTRVFCMASVLSSIPSRQNFLHFSAAYTAGRINNLNHAVGISHDGPEWGALVRRLHEVSDNIVTMDYSNFGPGYNAMVNAAGHDIIQTWTLKYVAGVNETELAVLGEEHYNSKHIMGNLVYKQLSGGPSGDALTVVKNGLVNEMYVLLAWKHLMSDWCLNNDRNLYESFYELTRLIVYGDDLIMSVADEIKDLFNGVTIKNFLAEYNITATDALKTGDDVPYTSILEASFLKCGFKPHPTLKREWLSTLDEISIEETAKWIHESPNCDEATRQNCSDSLRNAYGHGKKFFEAWRNTLNEALGKAGIAPIFITWEELDKNFFSENYEFINSRGSSHA